MKQPFYKTLLIFLLSRILFYGGLALVGYVSLYSDCFEVKCALLQWLGAWAVLLTGVALDNTNPSAS